MEISVLKYKNENKIKLMKDDQILKESIWTINLLFYNHIKDNRNDDNIIIKY